MLFDFWISLLLLHLSVHQGSSTQPFGNFMDQCENCTCSYYYVSIDSNLNRNTFADCSLKGFFNFPEHLHRLLDKIDLSQNPLYTNRRRAIRQDNQATLSPVLCRRWPRLISISLAHTGLSELGTIFKGCSVLQEINLKGNQLAVVDALDFEDTEFLTNLTLETYNLNPGAFGTLQFITKLDLKYHGLTPEEDLFMAMTYLQDLTLILTECQNVPKQLLNVTSLVKLNVTAYQARSMPTSFLFELDDLKELSLDLPQLLQLALDQEDQLQNLEKLEIKNVKKLATLSHLPALTSLRLEGINLQQEHPFGKLQNLIHLEVINCSLLTVPSQWFSNLTSLEELDLSQNGIMFLDKGWLSGLRSLKNLNLARNKLKHWPLALPTTLELLILRRNLIHILKPVDGLHHLKWLDLSNNSIKIVEKGAFAGFGKLIKIYLQQNSISNLDDDVFSDLLMLKMLDLSRNSFSEIPKAVIQSSVKHLLLDKNSINHLTSEFFCSMPSLEQLSLEDNPINCDCGDEKFLNCLANKSLQVKGTCSTPDALQNVSMENLSNCKQWQDLEQDTTHAPSILIIGASPSHSMEDEEVMSGPSNGTRRHSLLQLNNSSTSGPIKTTENSTQPESEKLSLTSNPLNHTENSTQPESEEFSFTGDLFNHTENSIKPESEEFSSTSNLLKYTENSTQPASDSSTNKALKTTESYTQVETKKFNTQREFDKFSSTKDQLNSEVSKSPAPPEADRFTSQTDPHTSTERYTQVEPDRFNTKPEPGKYISTIDPLKHTESSNQAETDTLISNPHKATESYSQVETKKLITQPVTGKLNTQPETKIFSSTNDPFKYIESSTAQTNDPYKTTESYIQIETNKFSSTQEPLNVQGSESPTPPDAEQFISQIDPHTNTESRTQPDADKFSSTSDSLNYNESPIQPGTDNFSLTTDLYQCSEIRSFLDTIGTVIGTDTVKISDLYQCSEIRSLLSAISTLLKADKLRPTGNQPNYPMNLQTEVENVAQSASDLHNDTYIHEQSDPLKSNGSQDYYQNYTENYFIHETDPNGTDSHITPNSNRTSLNAKNIIGGKLLRKKKEAGKKGGIPYTVITVFIFVISIIVISVLAVTFIFIRQHQGTYDLAQQESI